MASYIDCLLIADCLILVSYSPVVGPCCALFFSQEEREELLKAIQADKEYEKATRVNKAIQICPAGE